MEISKIIETNNIKIKPMPVDKILISIDRLTRFKFPEDKYLRVYKDIIVSYLISPKIKKNDLDQLDYADITELVEIIINYSIYQITETKNTDYSINEKLKKYESSIYKLDKNTKKLLENRIDYKQCLGFIDSNSPVNLRWLKSLDDSDCEIENRQKYNLQFPLEKVVIVEGATEEILLPKFAQILNYDFKKEGVMVIPAGGKNQVVKLYYRYKDILKIPIFVLLDKDALENSKEIKAKKRTKDKIHLLESGEFEDLLPLDLVLKSLNYDLKNISILEKEKLLQGIPKVKLLEEVYKNRGYHEFKKVDFAHVVYQNIIEERDISKEIEEIIQEIKNLC